MLPPSELQLLQYLGTAIASGAGAPAKNSESKTWNRCIPQKTGVRKKEQKETDHERHTSHRTVQPAARIGSARFAQPPDLSADRTSLPGFAAGRYLRNTGEVSSPG